MLYIVFFYEKKIQKNSIDLKQVSHQKHVTDTKFGKKERKNP